VAAAEVLEFGQIYMAQIVRNAQTLAEALDERGVPMLCAHKGYTRTHQAIADVRGFGGGMEAAFRLAQANIITNKNLLPSDSREDWDRPGGLRMGVIETTRLGMGEAEMNQIADFIARVLVHGETPEQVGREVEEFRRPFQTIYYCFENGKPA
jgi:glycine hydroxymethyltransferase